eukprot:6151813-Prymnesium_polylepis.3
MLCTGASQSGKPGSIERSMRGHVHNHAARSASVALGSGGAFAKSKRSAAFAMTEDVIIAASSARPSSCNKPASPRCVSPMALIGSNLASPHRTSASASCAASIECAGCSRPSVPLASINAVRDAAAVS